MLKLMEEVKSQVKTALQNNLSNRLATVMSRYADSVVLDTPLVQDYYDMITEPVLMNMGFPAVFIVGGSSSNNDVDGMRGDTFGAEMWFSHAILVVVVVSAKDELELTRKLQRYAIAVSEILCNPQNLEVGQCRLVRVMYDSPVYSDRGTGDLVQDIPIEFVVDSIETFD